LIRTWSIDPYIALDLAFSPDGLSLAVGRSEWEGTWGTPQTDTLKLLNISSGEVIKNFTGHTNAVSSVLFSEDGTWIASGSWDKTVKIWDVTTGNELYSFENHSLIVSSIALSSDELTLASSSFDKSINIWNVSSGELLEKITIPDQEVWSVAFSDNNSILAAAVGKLGYIPKPNRFWESFGDMQNASIQLWDVSNKKLLETLVGHEHTIESIDFSPDGAILASGSWDWTIKLWGDFPSLISSTQTDDWPTSTPKAEEVDSSLLNEISENWRRELHSLLVIRNGKLIFEKYYRANNHIYTKDSKHVLFSATKSFTSTLIGIAIDKGFINNISQNVLEFFPEYNFSNADSLKKSLNLRHLLTMTSGFSWSEEPSNDDLRRMYFCLDSVKYVLDKPMATEPGEYFKYNSGASHLLSAIIQKTTGKTAKDFALQYLFNPLGIEENDVVWMADSNGNAYGGIGLFLTPRNMAKLGQLFLDNGYWRQESETPIQVIQTQWIAASSSNQIDGIPVYSGYGPVLPVTGYGFQWWIVGGLNGFSAEGYQGQVIFVNPKMDLVIVFNARDMWPCYDIVEELLEAILPPESIPWWLGFLSIPGIIFILFIFRKRIFRAKRKA
jgi:CubicO group peptidase (beta-lactamase class C family)